MAAKRVDLGALAHMRKPAGETKREISLPGSLGKRGDLQSVPPLAADEREQPEAPAEEVAPVQEEPTPEAEAVQPEPKQPSEEQPDTAVVDETAEPVEEPPAKKEPAKTTRRKAPAKKAAPAKKSSTKPGTKATPKEEPAKQAEDSEELVSLDGRPARLWEITGGQFLPEGWAAIAVDRVSKSWRRYKADRRNSTLPDNVYQACNDYIYKEAQAGGLDLTLSNLAEAAFEQIPHDDPMAIQRLLDGLPDQYFDKALSLRPRTFQLLEPTLAHMQNLARMLRAQGFTGKAGLVQTAVLRELLIDLGMEVD